VEKHYNFIKSGLDKKHSISLPQGERAIILPSPKGKDIFSPEGRAELFPLPWWERVWVRGG